MSPQETEPDLPVSVQESPAKVWVDSGLLWGQGIEYNSAGISPFEGLRPNNREGTQPRPSTENWIKDLLSVAPPIRTRLIPTASPSL